MSGAIAQPADVLIVGAGPAGLSLACALADAGLRPLLLEQLSGATLAEPEPDGREIALTHRAREILSELGIWQRFTEAEISPIRAARVRNGQAPDDLGFDPGRAGVEALGYLVPNHVIRKAAYQAAMSRARVELRPDTLVLRAGIRADAAEVELNDGTILRAPLLVAADSRFSQVRRQLGVGAEMRDFGRTVIVCRLRHEQPGQGIAYECFGYGSTLAILPLNGQQVSAVITVPSARAGALMQQSPETFAALVQDQFGPALGRMQLAGPRHAYPLVAVHADRFSGARFALAGDAAVGMHPVTAHGFNLGLYGVERLARVLAAAQRSATDIGSAARLAEYADAHRRETWPMYCGTNALVGLFTDDRAPARLLRSAVMRVSAHLPPLKAAITRRLIDAPRRHMQIPPPRPGAVPLTP